MGVEEEGAGKGAEERAGERSRLRGGENRGRLGNQYELKQIERE